MNRPWTSWSKRLQAIARDGLASSRDPYDLERYHALSEIAAELLGAAAKPNATRTADPLPLMQAGATPKIDVRGAVFRGDSLLLVRERSDDRWALPGGWADVGDSPSTAVEREIAEEAGYLAKAVKLLAFYDRNRHGHPPIRHHTYKLFFLCELIGEARRQSIETDHAAFFREEELPELSVSRVTHPQICRLFEHHRHLSWPTDFD